MKKVKFIIFLIVFSLFLSSCSQSSNNNSLINNSIITSENQPSFPAIGKYWVIDQDNYLKTKTIESADEVLEQLRLDKIAEIAIIVQKGVKNHGPTNDEKIWAMKWGRWAKLGDKEDRLAVVWLIRPDVKPEENRVTVEVSRQLYQYTPIDYGPSLEEAAQYANVGDFDGTIESIVRNSNEVLRKVNKDYKNGE